MAGLTLSITQKCKIPNEHFGAKARPIDADVVKAFGAGGRPRPPSFLCL